jgi:Ca-activated chloride channel family protein
MRTRWRNGERGVANALALPLLLTALGCHAECQAPPPADSQTAQPYQISVNVNLVVLHATVRDRKGGIVSDLREQDFKIYEDGLRQSIRLFRHEDLAVTVGLVIDHSGSMQRKLADVIAAARAFVQYSHPEDQMLVVNFNENVTLGLPAAVKFTNSPDELAAAIWNTATTGKTALYDAVFYAQERLDGGNRNKKALILMSDGGDNASTHRLDDVLKMAGRSNVLIYMIGIFDENDPGRNPGVLKRLGKATSGEAFFPGQLSEVSCICERLARDIRDQYTLGYGSTNTTRSGAYRVIRVVAGTAKHGKLVVRARDGYIAADESQVTGSHVSR